MTASVLTPVQRQPDISYHPDLENFHSRTERLKPLRSPNPTLPDGFPQELTSPLVWEGKAFIDEREWTFSLSETQLQEINNALIYFKCE
jgi:hypothetical protein